jgi:hypothetical protein
MTRDWLALNPRGFAKVAEKSVIPPATK